MKKTVRNLSALFILLLIVPAFCGMAFADCQKGDRAEVLWKGKWYPATVQKANGDQCFIHYDGYSNSWDEWVGPDRIRVIGSQTPAAEFQEGDPVQVKWKGSWYDAHVLKVRGNQYRIHYDGYNDSWDEWVGPNRIRRK